MSEEINQPSFKESFATLKRIAENMRNQQDPDIDALLPQVDEATKAYAICKERVALVKQMLGEKLPDNLPA